jgi:general secretion pathway protein G
MIVYGFEASASNNKEIRTDAYIKAIENKLYSYKNKNGFFPKTDSGLKIIFENPKNPKQYSLPLDEWGNEYIYYYPAKFGNKEFDLYSYGKNGINDYGLKDDITNWSGFNTQYYSEINGIILSILLFFLVIIGWILRKNKK